MIHSRAPSSGVTFSVSRSFCLLIRSMTVLRSFDRVSLSIIADLKFGTVSRVLAQLHAGRFVEETGAMIEHVREDIIGEPYIAGRKLNYGTGNAPSVKSKIYVKTRRWPLLLSEWRDYLEGSIDT